MVDLTEILPAGRPGAPSVGRAPLCCIGDAEAVMGKAGSDHQPAQTTGNAGKRRSETLRLFTGGNGMAARRAKPGVNAAAGIEPGRMETGRDDLLIGGTS